MLKQQLTRISKARILVKRFSYLDRAPAWYDNHTRVFYIYSLGRYHNQHLFCYGDTNDLDVVEFNLAKTVPKYERVLYLPVDESNHSREQAIHNLTRSVPFSINGLEDWNIFTCENIDDVIQAVDTRKSVDWE